MQAAQNKDATFPSSTVSHLTEKGCIYTELVGHRDATLRLYVKPEDVVRSRWSETLRTEHRRFIKQILGYVDRNPLTWDGQWDRDCRMDTYLENGADQESLFYIFNTLDSPKPSVERVDDPYAYRSITDILQGNVQGLRTD